MNDDEPYVPRKEVNTALATNKHIPIVEPKAATRNIAGPPVYYPPGQELFGKSEGQAAWRAKVCSISWEKNPIKSPKVFHFKYATNSKISMKSSSHT